MVDSGCVAGCWIDGTFVSAEAANGECTARSPAILGSAGQLSSSITTWAFAVGDLNNDGVADVAQAGLTPGQGILSGGLSVFYGLPNSGRLVTGPFINNSSTFVAMGDLNGDGWADLGASTLPPSLSSSPPTSAENSHSSISMATDFSIWCRLRLNQRSRLCSCLFASA
jgi:hypothetical protein